MYTRLAVTLLAARYSVAAVAAVAVVAANPVAADAYWTNVDASFANMLSHEPYSGPTAVTVARGAKDPVELALHWREHGTPQVAAPTSYSDNVNASFQRMLDHTPYAGPTAVTVELGTRDPVERIVFEMLQDVRQPVRLAQR
jgi:plasmid stabilization system protein ParE